MNRYNLSVIGFTRMGYELSIKLAQVIGTRTVCPAVRQGIEIRCYVKCEALKNETLVDVLYLDGSLTDWAKEQFEERRAVVFIGAVGIAVRAIAGCVESKLIDSPVLVIDEMGNYVIPILSGHVGGANELAICIADLLGAVPVITTATDLEHRFAVDIFAKNNRLAICNKEGIAKVTAMVLEGKPLRIAMPETVLHQCYRSMVDHKESDDPELLITVFGTEIRLLALEEVRTDEEVDVVISEDSWKWMEDDGGNAALHARLYLAPREYVIGIGCKREEPYENIRAYVQQCLDGKGINWDQVAYITSIDLKGQEEGIRELSQRTRIPFVTFSVAELSAVEGDFQESEFVRSVTGIGNVCERSAMAACGKDGVIVQQKQAYQGKTVAIARRKWSVRFE